MIRLILNVIILMTVTADQEICRNTGSISEYALRGHVIKTINDKSFETCTFKCDSTAQCQSVNYSQVTHTCELNDKSRHTNPCDMARSQNGGLYMDSLRHLGNDACSVKPCWNGASCEVTSICPGYRCVCGSDLSGRLCEDCTGKGKALGMASKEIPDSAITASSYEPAYPPYSGRPHGKGWKALINDTGNPFFQVDIGRETLVSKISINGVPRSAFDNEACLKEFQISTSHDGMSWTNYLLNGQQTFVGCKAGSVLIPVQLILDQPIRARYIRINPVTMIERPALRLEIYGCDTNNTI